MLSHLPKVPPLVSEGIRLDTQVVCPQGPCDHAVERLARERALECANVKGLARSPMQALELEFPWTLGALLLPCSSHHTKSRRREWSVSTGDRFQLHTAGQGLCDEHPERFP